MCPDWFPFSAGLAQTTMEMAYDLEKKGHEVKIVVAKDKAIEDKGLQLIPIPYLFRLLGRNPIIAPVYYYNKLQKEIAWCDKICLVSYMYEMNSRIVIWKKLGLVKKPLIHFYMGSLEKEGVRFLSIPTRMAKQAWDATLGNIMFSWVDLTISNSQPTINYIHRMYNVPKKKLQYIPTAINLKEYNKSRLNNKRIIFIGRLIENKGVHHFEEILDIIPEEWKFTIIGDGPMNTYVKDLEEQFPQVEFLGKVPHSTVKKYLGISDINILPTYAEGSPRAVIESSASGVPSISFAVGDVETIVEKPFAIKDFNIKEFKEQLQKLIKDETLRKQAGERAYKLIHAHQDHKIVFKQIEETLEQIQNEREKN